MFILATVSNITKLCYKLYHLYLYNIICILHRYLSNLLKIISVLYI